MSLEILLRHRRIWQEKEILRVIYTEWYQLMIPQLIPGKTLEIGAGTGNFKDFVSNIVTTDIIPVPWIDQVADAQKLPFVDQSFDNLVLFDVLHHIEDCKLFFNEARRVLKKGGRVLIMDPYISWFSWIVFKLFHPEPVDFNYQPFANIKVDARRVPFDSNQAVATIIFERQISKFRELYPELKISSIQRLSYLAYPLSGGFENHSLLPSRWIEKISKIEKKLDFLSKFLAFRIFVVLQKEF